MYTKEEKKQIRKSRKAVVKDMRKIWNMHPYGEIVVPVTLNMKEYGNYWKLTINKKQIVLDCEGTYTKLYPRILKRTSEDGYTAHSQFITQYEKIREELLRTVTSRLKSKNEHIKKLEDISTGLKNKKEQKNKEAEVRIDLPESLNAKEIYVSEEGNKKVGVIDFGQQTIKIITEGNIVLVNKSKEEPKVKRK